MDKLSFEMVFKSIEQCFGKYPDIKKEMIFSHCSEISAESFRKICIYFIDNDKKPGVLDFKAKIKSYDSKPQNFSEEKKCADCFETGLVFIELQRGDGFKPLMRCVCAYGKNSLWDLPQHSPDLKKTSGPWEKICNNKNKNIWEYASRLRESIKRSKRIWEGLE
jgi:hypothetical protein